jgi:hypothetical protein
MDEFRNELFSKAKTNIDDAQMRQKRDYDRKHAKNKVRMNIIQSCMSSRLNQRDVDVLQHVHIRRQDFKTVFVHVHFHRTLKPVHWC